MIGKGIDGKTLRKELYRCRYLYAFIAPAVIWYAIFRYYPIYGILVAFKDYRYDRGIFGSDWVGFRYFIQFFNHYDFWNILRNTLTINVLKVVLGFPVPIILALLLNEIKCVGFKKVIQTFSYLPHFVSWVVVITLFQRLLSPYNGLVNDLLVSLKVIEKPVYFMGEKAIFYPLVFLLNIWKEVGWNAIIYLAALTNIDQELFSAAAIDGAGKFKQALHVTIPGILPTVNILFILNIGSLIRTGYSQIYLMQTPPVMEVAEIIDTYIIKTGIQQGRFSYATAVTLFQSIIALLLIVTANKISKKISDTALW